MEQVNLIFNIIEAGLFYYLLISAFYLGVYALFSLFPVKIHNIKSDSLKRFLILIPAYKEDKVIFDSVNSLLIQDYPQEKVSVAVISDGMLSETNTRLSELPVINIVLEKSAGSKANAMISAIDKFNAEDFDIAVIMDADNVAAEGFLSDINAMFSSGARAVQTHRTAKNLNTGMAVLDSVSEEINNSIFRKGHVNLGVSSALIGSGMAFDFQWFSGHVKMLSTAGEDKELELMLLREKIFIHYLENTYVYDEKTQKEKVFYNQRRRWIAAQFGSLKAALKLIPEAVATANFGFLDKAFQWLLLPRIIMLGLTGILALIVTAFDYESALKWWLLLTGIVLILVISIPSFLRNKRTLKAIGKLPWIFLLMMLNMFRIRGVNRKFIHTEKG